MARGFWTSFLWDSAGPDRKAPFREGGGIQKGGFSIKNEKFYNLLTFGPRKKLVLHQTWCIY